jgi:uncharacterized protein involved in exopolysaccharide biosynthesis
MDEDIFTVTGVLELYAWVAATELVVTFAAIQLYAFFAPENLTVTQDGDEFTVVNLQPSVVA